MGALQWFLFVYVFGGLTFIPLLIALTLAYIFYTSPEVDSKSTSSSTDSAHLVRPEDEKLVFKTGTDDLAEKFLRKHEADVAAGYFAVCREYVPGGLNGKPPDKLSPAGEVVAQESPSVYQTMYRSIFDRTQRATIQPNKSNNGKSTKMANNVFYVVLRHAHLMLYDDIRQLEVRYVISLEYHDVDISNGTDEVILEGELWQKRHAIRLKRKHKHVGDKASSLPFFLFSGNGSEKEDFYFALLRNQDKTDEHGVTPQEFDVKHIINLVQKLHSSEEQLQTRWLNALLGRYFLAVYRTPEMEQYVRRRLTSKMARVKKPNFITKLALNKIETGDSAPCITNPRLRDLTVNGECLVEADISYSGKFRVEIAATAIIDLGQRFKKREVDLVLATTVKKLEGHILWRLKPSPSNRLWWSFEKMPQLELAIEPIVSSRQITYNLITRAIESRIREVVAETIVSPYWDDIPFLSTIGQDVRGGIWKRDVVPPPATQINNEESEDEAEAGEEGAQTPEQRPPKDERTMSMPILAQEKEKTLNKNTVSSLNDALKSLKAERSPKLKTQAPRILRSSSFATGVEPSVTANHADRDTPFQGSDNADRDRASSLLKDLSNRSVTASPEATPTHSPPNGSVIAAAMQNRTSSSTSLSSIGRPNISSQPSPKLPAQEDADLPSGPPTPFDGSDSASTITQKADGNKNFAAMAKSMGSADGRKQAIANINAATTAAKTWGWGVIQKQKQKNAQANLDSNTSTFTPSEPMGRGRPITPSEPMGRGRPITPSEPMGRGRPLPPPGVPLPPPARASTIANPFAVPKRKPLPPPLLPKRSDPTLADAQSSSRKSSPRPPLPDRRKRQSSNLDAEDDTDEVLVVKAPTESAPTSPARDETKDDFFGHQEEVPAKVGKEKPPLPSRASTQVSLKVEPATPDRAEFRAAAEGDDAPLVEL